MTTQKLLEAKYKKAQDTAVSDVSFMITPWSSSIIQSSCQRVLFMNYK